ncbi:MAG: hypothetical protein QM497_09845 [Sulfurimonas sp.]
MRDFIYQLMTDYPTTIIFVHVFSAMVWEGGMIALWFIGFQTSKELAIEDRFADRVAVVKKYFLFLTPFILILFVTAIFFALGYKDNAYDFDGFVLDMNNADMYKLINANGSVFAVMVLNMFLILYTLTRSGVDRYKGNKAKDAIYLVNTFLLPLNIFLGAVGTYMGAFLRNLY